MNLINKYVAEVGKYLPRRNRADIEAEIRSTLEDMLDEQKQATGQADEATVIQMLKEYGTPRKVAESYGARQYLIGPRLYPTFILVTQIAISVLLVIMLVGLGLGLADSDLSGPGFLLTVGESLMNLLGSLIAVFGNIVLVFAILERTLPAEELEKETDEWDPAELASEPDPDRVKFGDQIATILFTAAFLIILNLYPNIIGFGFFQNDEWVFVSPILSDAFFSYLPYINILGVLEIVLSIILLRQGLWQTWTRITRAALELGNIALAVAMLRGSSLVNLTVEQFDGTPLAENAPVFLWVAQWVPTVVLTVVIVVASIEVGQTVYRLVKSRQPAPYPVMK
ncbi:MAG TPA: hypothetical protein VHO49_13995 [Anaerolineales bacterium]|nr:hypothetical protein [Anaerolineales bacterium]